MVYWFSPRGAEWDGRYKKGLSILGPIRWLIIGILIDMSVGLAQCKLECLAHLHGAKKLMQLSLGSTPNIITSNLKVACLNFEEHDSKHKEDDGHIVKKGRDSNKIYYIHELRASLNHLLRSLFSDST